MTQLYRYADNFGRPMRRRNAYAITSRDYGIETVDSCSKMETNMLDLKCDASQWQGKSPKTWTSGDILDWVYDTAQKYRFNMSIFKGESFQELDGHSLCSMSRLDFLAKEETFGDKLYACLQECLEQHNEVDGSWERKHPEVWTGEEILDWIFYVADLSDMDLSGLKAERFQGLTGKEICRMTLDDFLERDAKNGVLIYNSLQHLLSKCNFTPPGDFGLSDWCSELQVCSELSSSEVDELGLSQIQSNRFASWDLNTIQFATAADVFQHHPNPIIPSCVDESMNVEKRKYSNSKMSDSGFCSPMDGSLHSLEVKRFKTERNSTDEEHKDVTAKPKPPSKTRLWKFMRDLLDNPQYNPEYIRWENEKEGVFRIVSGRSKAIADLWGKIKNNPTMTFDKLGRSLRWCRANNGLFSAMPKNSHFPKKLCFRFKTNDVD